MCRWKNWPCRRAIEGRVREGSGEKTPETIEAAR